jgi:hypothetical protein
MLPNQKKIGRGSKKVLSREIKTSPVRFKKLDHGIRPRFIPRLEESGAAVTEKAVKKRDQIFVY